MMFNVLVRLVQISDVGLQLCLFKRAFAVFIGGWDAHDWGAYNLGR